MALNLKPGLGLRLPGGSDRCSQASRSLQVGPLVIFSDDLICRCIASFEINSISPPGLLNRLFAALSRVALELHNIMDSEYHYRSRLQHQKITCSSSCSALQPPSVMGDSVLGCCCWAPWPCRAMHKKPVSQDTPQGRRQHSYAYRCKGRVHHRRHPVLSQSTMSLPISRLDIPTKINVNCSSLYSGPCSLLARKARYAGRVKVNHCIEVCQYHARPEDRLGLCAWPRAAGMKWTQAAKSGRVLRLSLSTFLE